MTRSLILPAAMAVLLTTLPAEAASCGSASFYCCKHHGRPTASGERFNQNALTAAMPSRSNFGKWRVTHKGKSVVVRVNDTGGFQKYGRIIDLSKAAFAQLAPTSRGTIKVCLERLK